MYHKYLTYQKNVYNSQVLPIKTTDKNGRSMDSTDVIFGNDEQPKLDDSFNPYSNNKLPVIEQPEHYECDMHNRQMDRSARICRRYPVQT